MVTMGALYRPHKVEGHPNDMTLETTQSLENKTLKSCLCQGLDLTQKKKKFVGLKIDIMKISDNCRI